MISDLKGNLPSKKLHKHNNIIVVPIGDQRRRRYRKVTLNEMYTKMPSWP